MPWHGLAQMALLAEQHNYQLKYSFNFPTLET
jgi:hypothetical protein